MRVLQNLNDRIDKVSMMKSIISLSRHEATTVLHYCSRYAVTSSMEYEIIASDVTCSERRISFAHQRQSGCLQ